MCNFPENINIWDISSSETGLFSGRKPPFLLFLNSVNLGISLGVNSVNLGITWVYPGSVLVYPGISLGRCWSTRVVYPSWYILGGISLLVYPSLYTPGRCTQPAPPCTAQPPRH